MQLPQLQLDRLKEGAEMARKRAGAPARSAPVTDRKNSRKKPISLTISPALLTQLDDVAAGLGISRASAFSLAVSRFIASEKRGAN